MSVTGGRGGSSKGQSVYEYSDGSLYTISSDGKVQKVDIKDVPENAQIHTGQNAVNTVNNAVASNAGNNAANAIINAVANWKKKQ